jgi:hypothetical protein
VFRLVILGVEEFVALFLWFDISFRVNHVVSVTGHTEQNVELKAHERVKERDGIGVKHWIEYEVTKGIEYKSKVDQASLDCDALDSVNTEYSVNLKVSIDRV